ncbi:uridine kinase [Thomasclavelia cocleata]|uniref:Uridine kinase n=1 Tax=Thomasclavelia cocleata TaxID=69824 RepID=A0A1I0EBL0_9FIRM|nr:uridine kinase [Thomasclavelia cocleata]MCR1960836.1 uridine kinase [Thomasclavelia cocleata]NDO43325.1 uridine kinase [Thomasclavelia cocleata]PJN80403.1 uridine kinase [Thomasclavelia cocleata]SET42449.1 uridine kinase [Thomasclavelia cocleata]
MDKPVIIGIAGGSASGKTAVAYKIYEYFKGKHTIKIIKLDDYYKDQSHLTMEKRVLTNYDHPFAFDMELLVKHLDCLKAGQAIQKPIYNFELHNRAEEIETIYPRDVFILEGLFVLNESQIRQRCDILVYVDTDADIRFIRRLQRDMKERGRSLDSICNQYLTTVRPMHEQFIETSKKYAHIIIPEGGSNTVAIDLLITKICSIVEE